MTPPVRLPRGVRVERGSRLGPRILISGPGGTIDLWCRSWPVLAGAAWRGRRAVWTVLRPRRTR